MVRFLGGVLAALLASCAGNSRYDELDGSAGTSVGAHTGTPAGAPVGEAAAPTELLIEFRDAWGGRLVPSQVELLMSGWNAYKVIEIPADGSRLRLRLDIDWANELRAETGSKGFQSFVLVQPLRISVTEWGLPAGGQILHADLANISCGATWGFLDKTDYQGQIAQDRFCAEDYRQFWFEDAQGVVLWEAAPRQMDLSEVVRIDLGK